MAKQINYSKRDFASLRNEQVNLIKQYYPGLIQNFNDASVLSVFLDLNAAIADNLHFHIDRALQETVLDYAQERQSLFNIAKTYGLKLPGRSTSIAVCEFTVQVPVRGDAEDISYLPVMYAGSQFIAGNVNFELLYDVDFASNFNISGNIDRTKTPIFLNGRLSAYRIRKTGLVVSGASRIFTQKVVNTRPFYTIVLPENNVLSIESVIHKNGVSLINTPTTNEFNSTVNRWYEVNSLAEDSVFIEDTTTSPVNGVYKSDYVKVERRFMKEFSPTGFCTLTFGSMVDQGLDILDDFVDAGNFNLKSFLTNSSLGFAPIPNTTLYIKYRIGGGEDTNVNVGAINTVGNLSLRLNGSDEQLNTIVRNSITVNNVTPAIGGGEAPSIDELRNYIAYNFASQNRAVTLNDYKAIILSMPAKFGAPSKTSVYQDKNKINVSLLTSDSDGKLSNLVSSTILENVANYLSKYRMINDFVVVKPAEVIDLSFEIYVLVENGFQATVVSSIISTVRDEFTKEKVELGKSYLISNLVKKISQINGVLNFNSLRIFNKVGGDYSSNRLEESMFRTSFIDPINNEIDIASGIIPLTSDQILQIRFPERDIVVIPSTQNTLVV